MATRKRSDEALIGELERLAAHHEPEALKKALVGLLQKRKGFVPNCSHEYSYTYEYIVGVDDCPLAEDDERNHEDEAKKLAEEQVKKYCVRTDKCKTVKIVESSPTGGGCTCVNLPIIGKKCFYICRWTVKYKCLGLY